MHDVIDITPYSVRVGRHAEIPKVKGSVNSEIMHPGDVSLHLDGFSDTDSTHSDTSVEEEPSIFEQRRGFYPPTDLLRKCVLERQPSLIRTNSRRSFSSSRKRSDSRTSGTPKRLKRKESQKSDESSGYDVPDNPVSDECCVDISESDDFWPMIAGQCSEDADLPIMSPPIVETIDIGALKENEIRSLKFRFARSVTLKLLGNGLTNDVECGFQLASYRLAMDDLQSASEKNPGQTCHCVSNQKTDENEFCGWVNPQSGKTKNEKRRRQAKPVSSASAFGRLTGATNYITQTDPLGYQHFKDITKYMERYRFLHTIGRVCGPISNLKLPSKVSDGDLYFLQMKSTLSEMASAYDLYSLLSSQVKDRASYSNRRDLLDEEQLEDRLFDKSMKDRGKALNLTPVRDVMSPCFTKEQLDHFRENCAALNQYLNLMTPPMPVNCLRLELDESKTKRFRNRADSNLFPACTPRRSARQLRLGSADFIKPGPKDARWSIDRKVTQDNSSSQTSTVPGTLIVGSTVNQPGNSSANAVRVKNTGHRSPYVQFQKENQRISQHISGKRFESGGRSVEATSAKPRLTYTQASTSMTSSLTSGNMTSPCPPKTPCRTATMFDLQDPYMYPKRDRFRTITLDVNHLGIRGQPLRQDDDVTINCRGTRGTSLKS